MRYGIVGTMEEVNDLDVKLLIRITMDEYYCSEDRKEHDAIISGGTKGVDTAAQEFAKEEGLPFILFKPHFMLDSSKELNPKDFWIRDKQIIDNSDTVIIIGPKNDKRCGRCERQCKKRRKHYVRRYL